MTRKQIKKNAEKILAWEKVHSDPLAPEQDKRSAENNILQLTNMLMAMPNGIALLAEIDDIIQQQITNEKIQIKEND